MVIISYINSTFSNSEIDVLQYRSLHIVCCVKKISSKEAINKFIFRSHHNFHAHQFYIALMYVDRSTCICRKR